MNHKKKAAKSQITAPKGAKLVILHRQMRIYGKSYAHPRKVAESV
jgi:hypothetical protein